VHDAIAKWSGPIGGLSQSSSWNERDMGFEFLSRISGVSVQPKHTSHRRTILEKERRLLLILVAAAIVALIVSASRARIFGESSMLSGPSDVSYSVSAPIYRHVLRASMI
jgi:hypothetical protein